ncbi:Uncharacterised protein [Mycobacteroides abscessus subsp. abscessus]|nr:Uncharacterised protein [Mycobacteroides abscessus subsp. abscessus]
MWTDIKNAPKRNIAFYPQHFNRFICFLLQPHHFFVIGRRKEHFCFAASKRR